MVVDVRGRAVLPGAVAILLVAACTPTPSDGAFATASPATATATPRATPADPASIELHFLDARYVPAGVPVSTGGQLLWTAGEKSSSEIWRYAPGATVPERIFASPREASTITSVVGSAAAYAFVEQSKPAFGEGGWRVWFLSGAGAEPIELDRGIAKHAGAAPTLAMDDAHVAWAGFDEPRTGFVSRLGIVDIGDIRSPRKLLERPIRESLFWYPSLNGSELWYGTIHGDFDATGGGDEFHVEMLDLGNPAAPPVRFAGTGNDFNPAVNDAYVVWKTSGPGDSALNWGALRVLDRASQAVRAIPVDHANLPTIGERYVAFDEIFHARLAVYDPVTAHVLELAPRRAAGADGTVSYGGESLRGRLLTFFKQSAEGSGRPQIGWAVLPE